MNEQPPDNLMIELYTRVLNGEVLSERDLEKSRSLLYDMAMSNKISPKELKARLNKFRKAIPNFLSKLAEELNEVEAYSDRMYQSLANEEKRLAALPPLATQFDAPELVEFIRALTKEYYSFSEAERLMGVSRQTLTQHAKRGVHGLKSHPVGKSQRLHRSDMIKYQRATKFTTWNPITQSYEL